MRVPDPGKELIKNVKRRGGPFDTTAVPPTQCLACGVVFEKKLRWHYQHDGVCPKCGGRLDSKPLRKLTLQLVQKWKEAIDAVQI